MRSQKIILQKKNQKLEYPSCNICKSKSSSVVLSDVTSWEYKGKFTIVKCTTCNLVYLYPRPTIKEIGKYYSPESYWGENITINNESSELVKEREYTFGSIYKKVLTNRRKGAILDIGAGTGIFLSKFKEAGWKAEGVEFSPDAVKFAQKSFGITLKRGDFFDHTFPNNTYDVVSLNMALEHLYQPLETLKEIKKILKKNGVLVITVPNIDSVGFGIFQKDWQALNLPRHLYQFNPSTLQELVSTAGFKKEEINYWYWAHNYYTVFESFRFRLSPRFRKTKEGGLVTTSYKKTFSPKKELGKLIIRSLTICIVLLGSLTRKSESITLYATKA
jgi:SAM-dependent methyltransferase